MLGKIGKFFEDHIEKVVLVVAGLISFWLLITNVVLSPNHVQYQSRRFGPGSIDSFILRTEAEPLLSQLDQEPEPAEEFESRSNTYVALLDSSAAELDTSLTFPYPIHRLDEVIERKYAVPAVPDIDQTTAAHIRTVALLPRETVDIDNPYSAVETEPDDIDLISIEGRFDYSQLLDEFEQAFAGENVRAEWRDPSLADPVFAGIELQRQQLDENGQWGQWQNVRRTRICRYRDIISENVDRQMPSSGSIRVRLLQLSDEDIQRELLQPAHYNVVLAGDRWLPPSLYPQYARITDDIESEQRRQERADERQQPQEERPPERRQTTTTTARTGLTGGAGRTTPERRERPRPDTPDTTQTEQDRLRELQESLSTIESQFAQMSFEQDGQLEDTIALWAHDDTVQPGRSYRYRMRIGAFNPIAGTNQFAQGYEDYRDQPILWSSYTEPTSVIDIPERIYFFPLTVQETAKLLTVQVSRYRLGYWYSREFNVRPGELIGRRYEPRLSDDLVEEGAVIPETIDFRTGVVYVDVSPVNVWAGQRNLRPQQYFDMLYTYDGLDISRLGVMANNWPDGHQSIFARIRRAERAVRKPFTVETRPDVASGLDPREPW